jgi:hypothetical protein
MTKATRDETGHADDLPPILLSALTHADLDDHLARLARVRELASQCLGREMLDDESDLDIIQGLFDRRVADDHDLECLGLALGMCLARAVGELAWVVVEDQHGRCVALRYGELPFLAYPLGMIAKRAWAGKAVDVREMFKFLVDQIDIVTRTLSPGLP